MVRSLVMGALFSFISTASLSAEETWARKLGYAETDRVVIFHAADMGAAYEFNYPGQVLLERNIVQSAGVMVPCPWFEEFADWCRTHPGHDIGVSLTLTSPSSLYRWGPVSPPSQVPTLVDAVGRLAESITQFAMRADVEEVQLELDAQIARARAAGIRPTHISPSLGALLTRVDLTQAYLETAERNWIPAVMVEMTPENIERLRNDGFPLTQEIIDVIRKCPLPKLDDIRFIEDTESYEQKREAMFEMIRGLRPGLTEIVVTPAENTRGLQRVSPRWENRVFEARLMTDPEVHAFLENEGIITTNWIEVMRRFESGIDVTTRGK